MQRKLAADRIEAIHALRESWRVDYSAARARALSWLRERYLLASPINRRAAIWSGPHGSRGADAG